MDPGICGYCLAVGHDLLVRQSKAAEILNVGSWSERAIAADRVRMAVMVVRRPNAAGTARTTKHQRPI